MLETPGPVVSIVLANSFPSTKHVSEAIPNQSAPINILITDAWVSPAEVSQI